MKVNISENVYWITKEDKCVIYCFTGALEMDTDFLTQEEVEDIIIGGNDQLQEEYTKLSKVEKERVISRVNDLIDAYQTGKVYDE